MCIAEAMKHCNKPQAGLPMQIGDSQLSHRESVSNCMRLLHVCESSLAFQMLICESTTDRSKAMRTLRYAGMYGPLTDEFMKTKYLYVFTSMSCVINAHPKVPQS